MRESKSVNQLKLSQEQFLEKLTWQNTYTFACWQLPNETSSQLIISLKDPENHHTSLEESDAGFLVNSYNDSHPIKPKLIAADITVDSKGNIEADPRVSSNDFEEFIEFIQNIEKEKNKETIPPSQSENDFAEFVSKTVAKIKSSEVFKIVPSRFEDVLVEDIDYSQLFQIMCKTYPTAFCNIWRIKNEEIWIGATPESLISFKDNVFSTVALAGTQALSENDKLSNIAWTQKEIEEQALVSRYIINCFKKLRIREFEEYGPKTIAAGSLAHLCTTFEVDLSKVHFEQLADQMLELLHPTSAVCGMPREEASKFLEENEGYDRSFYAGFIGPVNFDSETNLFVNLRCMSLRNRMARLYAGAGVTEDSIPEKELAETVMKMEVMKSLIQ